MDERKYLLEPKLDSRKSFYGKAKVISNGNEIKLQSYNTIVAKIFWDEKGQKQARIFGTYSPTTLRHIKDFLYQHGFYVGKKSEIIDLYWVD